MKFPRLLSCLGKGRGTDRNRRDSAPLSPIFSLFLAPVGILYQKVQRLLTEEEPTDGSHLPVNTPRAPPRTASASSAHRPLPYRRRACEARGESPDRRHSMPPRTVQG